MARDEAPDPAATPSKSQRKRAADELKALGDELVCLPVAEFDALALPERLRDAVGLARRITARGARARQRQLIGKLLRDVDVGAIRTALGARALASRLAAREFHRVEIWRDRLLAEGEAGIAALVAAVPGVDAAHVRALVARASADAAAGRPPAAARELFRWLRAALAAAAGAA